MFRQVDSTTAFEVAVLALVGWLCVFAFGHVIHAPVLLREGHHHDKARSQHWGFGILGVVILMVIASTVTAITMWLWVDRTPALAVPSAAPALQVTIEAQKREIASLKARVPDEKSLKLRLLALADEYEQFWKRQPKMPTCKTTAGMTQQQIQDEMQRCSDKSNWEWECDDKTRILLHDEQLLPKWVVSQTGKLSEQAPKSRLNPCFSML